MRHEFLVLSVLFLVPGALFAWARPDLRGLMARSVLFALPFATTEWLFYPAYWTPRFLFDLADHLGFGIEDVLFVAGLAAFASTGYAVVFRRAVVSRGRRVRPVWRAVGALGGVLGLAGLAHALGAPILYASVGAMVVGAAALLGVRRDLLGPGLLGGLVSVALYLVLCLVFARLVPGVFERTWRPSLLLAGRFLGVPWDELLYGFGAGVAATAFPAWAFGLGFVPRAREALPAGP
ncbi:lycopene cyclase domain-containing protein [Melittangium boletus]|uniref:lycopene cyclase domain-containing protein n=1 Tax=Melittangium boletus TaxID=83453 RepID=UPI003DA4E185